LIAELATLIRRMAPGERAALADELTTPAVVRVRCPSQDIDSGSRCVRNEGHHGEHVGSDGSEWLVALRCRIGADDRGAVCDRLHGHEGACVPRPRAQEPPPLARPARSPWGICACGKPRKEHEGGVGRCEATGCKKYGKAKR
jgi:hypothetical protein